MTLLRFDVITRKRIAYYPQDSPPLREGLGVGLNYGRGWVFVPSLSFW